MSRAGDCSPGFYAFLGKCSCTVSLFSCVPPLSCSLLSGSVLLGPLPSSPVSSSPLLSCSVFFPPSPQHHRCISSPVLSSPSSPLPPTPAGDCLTLTEGLFCRCSLFLLPLYLRFLGRHSFTSTFTFPKYKSLSDAFVCCPVLNLSLCGSFYHTQNHIQTNIQSNNLKCIFYGRLTCKS